MRVKFKRKNLKVQIFKRLSFYFFWPRREILKDSVSVLTETLRKMTFLMFIILKKSPAAGARTYFELIDLAMILSLYIS